MQEQALLANGVRPKQEQAARVEQLSLQGSVSFSGHKQWTNRDKAVPAAVSTQHEGSGIMGVCHALGL